MLDRMVETAVRDRAALDRMVETVVMGKAALGTRVVAAVATVATMLPVDREMEMMPLVVDRGTERAFPQPVAEVAALGVAWSKIPPCINHDHESLVDRIPQVSMKIALQ